MIVLEIELPRDEYLVSEGIPLQVRISNTGTEAVQVPALHVATNNQPVFGLTRPESTSPELLTRWGMTHAGRNGAPPPELQLVPLAPGAATEHKLQLHRMAGAMEQGEYRIAAGLAMQDTRVRGKEDKVFRVSRPNPVSLHFGQGERPLDVALGQLAFVQKEASGTSVYFARFQESDPVNSELDIDPLFHAAQAGPNATDIAVPWRNSPFFDELMRWIVWREGKSIKALSNSEKTPSSIDLPVEPDTIVRPPLKVKGGPVEILALHGKSLTLITVPPRLKATPAIAWQAELPFAPESITAALGPDGSRHIAFAVNSATRVGVFHCRYTETGLDTAYDRAQFEGGTIWPGAPLSLAVTDDGVAHIGLMQANGDERRVLEVTFGGSAGQQVHTLDLPKREEKPFTAGSVRYVTAKGKMVRREVVLLAGDEIWNLPGGGSTQLTQAGSGRAYVTPLVIAPGRFKSYVLYQDSSSGRLQFQPLNR